MSSPSFDFKEILDRYLKGKSSDEEKALLFRFYEEYGGETAATLTKEEEAVLLQDFKRLAGVQSTTTRSGRIRKIFMSTYSRAAIFLLLAGGVFLLGRKYYGQKNAVFSTAIKTGSGQVRKVMLPDSSLVTLNAKSSIRFNEEEFKAHREIILEGEALFQVVHDGKYPFIVHTSSGLYVQDLGTEFVVSNYTTLPDIKVSVLSGLVRVGSQDKIYGTLKHNQEIRYDLAKGTVKTDSLHDLAQCTAWNTGQWVYNNMTFPDLRTLLGNNYNITVFNKMRRDNEPYVEADMNFSKDQKPEEILNIFSLAARCHYRWTGKDSVEIY